MAREPQRRNYVLHERSFAALVRMFMSPVNQKWFLPQQRGGYAWNTKISWQRELLWMAQPECLGDVTIEEIRPSLVQMFFDGIADRPGKQYLALRALSALETWAIARDLLGREITRGIKITKTNSGHVPWTDAQVAAGERYAAPHLSMLVTLGAYTGQRISDMIRMGWTDVERYDGRDGIRVIQKKTGRRLWVPILGPLATAMATWPRRPGPWLRNSRGTPWRSPVNTQEAWAKERENNPNLAEHKAIPLVIHGLRGHACVRLSRLGLSDHEIGEMIGMTPNMVSRYTRHSRQQDNAMAAVIRLEGAAQARKERDAG